MSFDRDHYVAMVAVELLAAIFGDGEKKLFVSRNPITTDLLVMWNEVGVAIPDTIVESRGAPTRDRLMTDVILTQLFPFGL